MNVNDVLRIIVAMPAKAPAGATDMATITVASQGNTAESATATLITSVQSSPGPAGYKLLLPLIVK